MPKYQSDIAQVVHQTVADLYDSDFVDKQTMREFDKACLTPITPLSPNEIRQVREKTQISQTVFAHYLVASLANSLPLLAHVKDMDERGKVMAIAFMVPAAFVFGDHLAYASANLNSYLLPIIVAKLLGGILAVILASFLAKEQ